MQQSITITPLDLEEGLVILYIYDITFLSETNYKLEMAKKNLSEKNEELRLILDTTMEAIIIFKDNSVVDCNKIAIELFNKQMKYELINKSFDDLKIQDWYEASVEELIRYRDELQGFAYTKV